MIIIIRKLSIMVSFYEAKKRGKGKASGRDLIGHERAAYCKEET